MNSVSLAMPSSTGYMMNALLTMESPGDGTGRGWVKNIENFSESNRTSITNVMESVRWLIGRPISENITIEFEDRYETVTGNSWDMMLALGMAALLTNKPLKPGYTGSATILDDHASLGRVGGLNEKFRAARGAGYTHFILSDRQLPLTYSEVMAAEGLELVSFDNLYQAWFAVSGASLRRLSHAY